MFYSYECIIIFYVTEMGVLPEIGKAVEEMDWM